MPPAPTISRLPVLDDVRPPSMTDQVFDILYDRVVNLALPPGEKLSEAEVAAQLGVSRQPVRDAFFRLSQLGFLLIRPQRATTISPISEDAVRQAQFIRSALEADGMRRAAQVLTAGDLDDLDDLIAQQVAAVAADDHATFHELDDAFHKAICDRAGLDFVWTLVKENKGHMDRARYLSLIFGGPRAIEDHRTIMDALRARDPDAAVTAIRAHLGQIEHILDRLRRDRPEMFQGV